MRELSSKERCISNNCVHVLLIARQEHLSNVLNVIKLALVDAQKGLNSQCLAHFIKLISSLVIPAESVLFAEIIQNKGLLSDLVPQTVHLFAHHLNFSENSFRCISDIGTDACLSANWAHEGLNLLKFVALHLVPSPGHDRLRELQSEVIS